MTKNKIIGALLVFIGLFLNFCAIEFTGIGFIAGAICAIGLALFLFEFPFLTKRKNHD